MFLQNNVLFMDDLNVHWSSNLELQSRLKIKSNNYIKT